MYQSFLCEITDVNDALDEINDKGLELVSSLYIADSGQVLLIVKDSEKKSFLKEMRKSIESKKETEEGEKVV